MQSEDKNGSVQLSTRYQQYDFAKRHLGGFGGRQVFPIGGGNSKNPEVIANKNPSGRGSNGRVFSAIGIAGTLTAGGDNPSRNRDVGWNSGYYLDDTKIRRLTPTECERLMGLPDGWTEGVSDTQRYKLCGNGVVVNVVEEIVKRIIK